MVKPLERSAPRELVKHHPQALIAPLDQTLRAALTLTHIQYHGISQCDQQAGHISMQASFATESPVPCFESAEQGSESRQGKLK